MELDNHEKALETLVSGYLDREKTANYWAEAMTLLDDIKYLEEHANRTQKSKRFSFRLLPDMSGLIYGMFVREAMQNLLSYGAIDKKYVGVFLKIFDVAVSLLDAVEKNRDDKLAQEKLVSDFNVLDKVSNWYLGVKVSERLGAFVGSSYAIENIRKYLGLVKDGES